MAPTSPLTQTPNSPQVLVPLPPERSQPGVGNAHSFPAEPLHPRDSTCPHPGPGHVPYGLAQFAVRLTRP